MEVQDGENWHFRVAKTMKSELVILGLGQTVSFLYGLWRVVFLSWQIHGDWTGISFWY